MNCLRALVYVTGMTCGVLAAIAAEILLRRTGVEIADTWRSLASGQSLQMRAVSVFWLMIGSAFVVSAVVAAALSRLPPPWLRLRTLRWLASAVLVFALAEVGHIAAITAGHGGGASHRDVDVGACGRRAGGAVWRLLRDQRLD